MGIYQDSNRCGNTIHSDYVSDHRCQRFKGHVGDCWFGRRHPHDEERYQIALREDDLGLDDVVVKNVSMFRMERMSEDYVWFACYLDDGQDIHFYLWLEDGIVKYKALDTLPDVKYEA